MKALFLLFLLCLFSVTSFSQTDSLKVNSSGIFEGEPDSLPSFIGGKESWVKFLQKNLNAFVPVENGAPKGTYKPVVSFIVDENGNLSDFKIEINANYGTTEELIRLLKKSPVWKPAYYHNAPVKYRTKQEVVFNVFEG